jgi:hypothetical protein
VRIIATLFALTCLALWYPVKIYLPIQATERIDPRPAGEITSQFNLIEEVNIQGPLQKEFLPYQGALCVGLRFATFKRANDGEIEVLWQEGRETKSWRVESDALDYNELRYFCPGKNFDPASPFIISVRGRVGVSGKSPTVWLTSDSHLGRATINGHVDTRSLDLSLARERRRSPLMLAQQNDGAFLISSFCTVFMGLFSLAWMRRRIT